MDQRYEDLANILKNQADAENLFSLSVDQARVVLLEEYHLDFSIEELNGVAAGIRAAADEDMKSELTSSDLDNITGGKSAAYNAGLYVGKTVKAIGSILKTVAKLFGA